MRHSKICVPMLAAALLAGGVLFHTTTVSVATAQPQSQYLDCCDDGGGYGQSGGQGRGTGMNLSPEQRTKVNALVQETQTKMQSTRDQLFVKHEELQALQQASTPDVNAVSKKAQEINILREQMNKERTALGQKIDKELGLPEGTHASMGGGYGYGRGGRGYGHGYGRSGMGYGRGGRGGCY